MKTLANFFEKIIPLKDSSILSIFNFLNNLLKIYQFFLRFLLIYFLSFFFISSFLEERSLTFFLNNKSICLLS